MVPKPLSEEVTHGKVQLHSIDQVKHHANGIHESLLARSEELQANQSAILKQRASMKQSIVSQIIHEKSALDKDYVTLRDDIQKERALRIQLARGDTQYMQNTEEIQARVETIDAALSRLGLTSFLHADKTDELCKGFEEKRQERKDRIRWMLKMAKDSRIDIEPQLVRLPKYKVLRVDVDELENRLSGSNLSDMSTSSKNT